jgi:hypothetical protein
MVTIPLFPAVTLIPVVLLGVVAPAGTTTKAVADGEAVESDTTEASLLVSVKNTASAAGDDKDTGSTAVSPGFRLMAESTIAGPTVLVSENVAVAIP